MVMNLLNLYSLIFALFVKIEDMVSFSKMIKNIIKLNYFILDFPVRIYEA